MSAPLESAAFSAQVATFAHFTAKGTNRPLREFIEGIRSGRWRDKIEALRKHPKGTPKAERLKKSLPCCMLSCSTNGGKKRGDVTSHSGLLQFDIDSVGTEHADNLRDRIGEDRHVLASWVSPSGDGVKGIVLIPSDVAQHKASFEAAADYLHETYGVAVDSACSNVNRLCYVSYDPEIVFNEQAVVLPVAGAGLAAGGRRQRRDSSVSAYCITKTKPILYNSAFVEHPNLVKLYQSLVSHRFGKPSRGTRNEIMVEIVASCFYAIAPGFVTVFAEEYYHSHAEAFADYDFELYLREVANVLNGCTESFKHELTTREREALASLEDERAQVAFRICRSLANCDSDEAYPPPKFFISCDNLATRTGTFCMQAGRTLQYFVQKGWIEIVQKGTQHAPGIRGEATVYRWMLKEA